jgi:hypothetical protein
MVYTHLVIPTLGRDGFSSFCRTIWDESFLVAAKDRPLTQYAVSLRGTLANRRGEIEKEYRPILRFSYTPTGSSIGARRSFSGHRDIPPFDDLLAMVHKEAGKFGDCHGISVRCKNNPAGIFSVYSSSITGEDGKPNLSLLSGDVGRNRSSLGSINSAHLHIEEGHLARMSKVFPFLAHAEVYR